MKILVVGAHPADAVDLAGGTMAQHSLKGDKIEVVTVTDGIYSHTSIEGGEEKVRQIKRQEVLKAVSKLVDPCDHFFMGLRDEPLMIGVNSTLELVRLIREIKPNVVIAHHPNEYAHWDHAEVGKMVCRALKGCIKLPGDKWWVDNVYFFATQFRPETARLGYVVNPPDILIDISDVVENKVKAMFCFESQGHNDESMLWKRMKSFEREMGRPDGLEYSEGFIFYYPLKEKLLPLSGINKAFYKKEDLK